MMVLQWGFPSICNKYTTPETYRKDLARKWNIYYIFEYISPCFPSSVHNQILVSLFPLLSPSCYLVVLPKMSSCVVWRTHGFTFALVILLHNQILVSLFPLISPSCYLVVLPKMSSCVVWRTHGFTFALVILYATSTDRFPIPYLSTFPITDSKAGGL
jgi:hypothetical protein